MKTTPGHACNIAEAFDARWIWPRANSTVKEARDQDNCTVAYYDQDGWFVHSSLAGLGEAQISNT